MRPARIIGDRSGGERVKREKRRRTERRLSAAIGRVRGKRAGPLCRSPSDSAVSRPESPLPGGEKARLGRGGWTACKTRDGSAGHAGGKVERRQELSRKLTDRPACTWRGGNERGQGPWRCERFSAARERCWSGRCGQRGKSTRYEWLGKGRGMRRNAGGGWILSAPAERRHVLPESFAAVSTLSLGGREEAVCAFILFNRGCKGDGRTRGWGVV